MLSDVGYGLILVALCAWLTFKVKPSGIGQIVAHVSAERCQCGHLGFYFWRLFRQYYFGIVRSDFRYPADLVQSMNDPIQLLLVSVVLGVIHLFAGLGVQAYMLFKTNRVSMLFWIFSQFMHSSSVWHCWCLLSPLA